MSSLSNNSIAIVGMACRYPDAETPEQLLVNSLAARRSFRKIPEARLSSDYFDPSGKNKDRAYMRQAAVLNGFDFDRDWFRISRTSYDATDLTHWLALSVAREAIDGIRFRKRAKPLDNEGVRVIVGNTLAGEFSRASVMRLRWPYVKSVLLQTLQDLDEEERKRVLREMETRYKSPFPVPNEDFLAGGLANTIAGRICNYFDFKGGGYTVDGACSSSLLAVSEACSALLSGDADFALAGGVDLSLDPFELVGFSRSAALARSEMLVYDERSEGFWPGEGCGFVALMRYDDALEQCERIHAVIRGWGISSDGRGGLTRPEAEGQMLALQRCYRRADYGIETVGYFEGHGTGTKVGDTAELRALIGARKNAGRPMTPAVISSIKANIGHTKAAAGLAGLIRATLCVEEGVIPPTTGCQRPHALLVENAECLSAAERPMAWEAKGAVRRAGISAMGFGGINTHIAIEAAPALERTTVGLFEGRQCAELGNFQDAELFLFAAQKRDDLAWTVGHLLGFAEAVSRAELTDLAAELARRATRGSLSPWKAAIVAGTPSELKQKLELLKTALAAAGDDPLLLSMADGVFLARRSERGKIGLLFSGQGAPVRAKGGIHARRFDSVRQAYLDAGLDKFAERDDTDFAQPAIATASLAGLETLNAIGVQGDVAVGHSLGELCALHWAGYFDRGTLLTLAKLRGRLTVDDTNTDGAMAAIAADREHTAAAIGEGRNLFVANINSPRQTVVSGDRDAVEKLVAELRQEGIASTVLRVRRAFHTPAMAGVAATFKGALRDVKFDVAKRAIVSTITGAAFAGGSDIAAYLSDQLVAPVEFMAAVNLAAEQADFFIEVGPGDVLTGLAPSFCGKPVMPLDIGGDTLAPLLLAAAAAYVLDCAPAIANLFRDRFARKFDWNWRPRFLQNPCETFRTETEPQTGASAEAEKGQTNVPIIANDVNISAPDLLRQIISGHTGLPAWTLQDSSRMSSELHLNSITVGELIAQFTAARGLPMPFDPTEYADASIGDIATALDRLEAADTGEDGRRDGVPAGLGSWVRRFEVVRVPAECEVRAHDTVRGVWEAYGAIVQHETALLGQLNAGPHGDGVIVWLGDDPRKQALPSLLQAAHRAIERARDSAAPLRFVIVQHGWGGSGFARSFFLENTNIRTLIINIPLQGAGDPADWIMREIASAGPGLREVFFDKTGRREEPRLRLAKTPPAAHQLMGKSDMVLVTGGGKGISAECCFQLACKTHCALLIIGRSSPNDDGELAANLKRMQNAKLRVSYQMADVIDAAAVALAVSRGCAELGGAVTGIVHGAGLNTPHTAANLTLADIQATVSPKITGFANVIAAADPQKLKLLVNFGSIIARIGLKGEADYALANEWLGQETEAFKARYPDCRCCAIEWSVWSGVGMGQRLGRLDALERQGISPVSVDDGVREFLQLVDTPELPARLIVSGRFGSLPTVAFDTPQPPRLRFIESILVYYPGTELIAECRLTSQTDPYLDDHVLDGERICPAVMALEAMTQAAATLLGMTQPTAMPILRNVRFRKAIVVPRRGDMDGITLRIIALVRENGDIALAVRCSTTDFQVNHAEARCVGFRDGQLRRAGMDIGGVPAAEILSLDPDVALYRNVLFQSGRFKRIGGYQTIEARNCSVQIAPAADASWFSQDMPQTRLLGDPGARDAVLHAVQACIPHKIVIPVAVEEIELFSLDARHAHRVFAVEVEDRGAELIYDLTVCDPEGNLLERWNRITIRAIGEQPNMRILSPYLMVSFFERRVADSLPQAGLKVSIALAAMDEKRKTAIRPADHRPDGKPDPKDQRFRSAAYDGSWKLAVDAEVPLGCDLQHCLAKQDGEWQRLLGQDGCRLAQAIAGLTREGFDISATRIWTVREAMKKAGFTASAPLALDPDSKAQWIVLYADDATVFSSLIEQPDGAPICIAVALKSQVASELPAARQSGFVSKLR